MAHKLYPRGVSPKCTWASLHVLLVTPACTQHRAPLLLHSICRFSLHIASSSCQRCRVVYFWIIGTAVAVAVRTRHTSVVAHIKMSRNCCLFVTIRIISSEWTSHEMFGSPHSLSVVEINQLFDCKKSPSAKFVKCEFLRDNYEAPNEQLPLNFCAQETPSADRTARTKNKIFSTR